MGEGSFGGALRPLLKRVDREFSATKKPPGLLTKPGGNAVFSYAAYAFYWST